MLLNRQRKFFLCFLIEEKSIHILIYKIKIKKKKII